MKIKISEAIKNGNSHKGKTYEELYTDNAEYEKEKRRLSVKKSWNEISDDKKNKRVVNMRNAVRKNSKYSEDLIKEIKEKLKSGIKIKELSKSAYVKCMHFKTIFLINLNNTQVNGDSESP